MFPNRDIGVHVKARFQPYVFTVECVAKTISFHFSLFLKLEAWWWLSRTAEKRSFLYYYNKVLCNEGFLLITNLMYFSIYLFIHFISLHVSSIKCSSSGDPIVLIHHMVWLVCVSDCLVCRSEGTGIPSGHLHRLIIPYDVLIQLDLLMMSTWCSKHVER